MQRHHPLPRQVRPSAPGLGLLLRRLAVVLAALAMVSVVLAAPNAAGWELAGRLGLAQYFVVPEDKVADRAYHDAIIREVCGPKDTCFLRFFANPQQAPVGLPLPDSIEQQPTAIFQRSAKYQREEFRWSCRLKLPDSGCF